MMGVLAVIGMLAVIEGASSDSDAGSDGGAGSDRDASSEGGAGSDSRD